MSRRILSVLLSVSALLIGFSSVSTRAAGWAWFCLSFAGILAWLSARRQSLPPQTNPGAQIAVLRASRLWLWACLSAWVLMAIPTAYWSGPWPERHPQLRVLIGALGIWLLLRHHKPSARWMQTLGHAAALSSLLAYALVVTASSDAAPTNRIPWMAGLSLFACALLSMSYVLSSVPLATRRWWLAASALMGVTVLLSGVRGSWLLVLVWPMALWGMHRSDRQLWQGAWRWLLPMLAMMLAIGLQRIPDKDNPLIRIQSVVNETGVGSEGSSIKYDSSSGVRLALYKAALSRALNVPWMGLGPAENKQLIAETLTAHDAQGHIPYVGHWHNDWLHPWLEFGFLGLAGYLAYSVGLWLASRALSDSPAYRVASIGLRSLLSMHLITGLSNMNLAHNFYPTMLALSFVLVLLAAHIRSEPIAKPVCR